MMASSKTDDAPNLELGLVDANLNDTEDTISTRVIDGGTAIDKVIEFLNPTADHLNGDEKLDTQVKQIANRVDDVEYKVNAVHDKVEKIANRPETVIEVPTPSSSPSPLITEGSSSPPRSEKTVADLTAELQDFL